MKQFNRKCEDMKRKIEISYKKQPIDYRQLAKAIYMNVSNNPKEVNGEETKNNKKEREDKQWRNYSKKSQIC